MDHDTLLNKLRKEVEYAWNSYSLPLVYQTHGKVCMVADLGAITYPEFCELDTKLIREGLNNPKWFNDPRFHMVSDFEHEPIHVVGSSEGLSPTTVWR